jgi:molybdate transport system ATP-binding protein
MAEKFLELKNVTVKPGGTAVLEDINLIINRGEQWMITGSSGSGKTVFAHTLLGKHFFSGEIYYFFSDNNKHRIAMVDQQHRFKNLSNTNDLYYQQRFNSSDSDQTITVAEELKEYIAINKILNEEWMETLHIHSLLSKPLIQLSNGENKRVQLAIALIAQPELLILDNPFLGLDIEGRKILHAIINNLTRKGMHVLLISSANEIPEAITHIAVFEKGKIIFAGKKENYHLQNDAVINAPLNKKILNQLNQTQSQQFLFAVKMINVNIIYGDAVILNNINWQVKKGERWNLSGPNGAGKSTLLSLITADNPQAYANEIYLFDKRRGSGESIWDIKKNIGFVSPELHIYFDYSATCFEVIASGLFDTIGLFRQLNKVQEEKILLWMKLLQLENLKSKRLAQLSTGQQRMILLARALIKNPPLLILDEPCQGLDDEQTNYFKNLITQLCRQFDTTLIYVSHYKNQIPDCVDHFLQLEKGNDVSIK